MLEILQNKVAESGNQPHCQSESSYEGANGSNKVQVLPHWAPHDSVENMEQGIVDLIVWSGPQEVCVVGAP